MRSEELPMKELFGAVANAASISDKAFSPTDEVGVFSNIIAFCPMYNCSPSGKLRVVEHAISKSTNMNAYKLCNLFIPLYFLKINNSPK